MNEEEIKTRIRILLSIQKALLGAISSHLRAVFVDWTKTVEKLSIKLYFVFDQRIMDDDKNDGHCVTTKILSDIGNGFVEIEFLQVDYPEPIPRLGTELIYERKE